MWVKPFKTIFMNERKRQEELKAELLQSQKRMGNCKHNFSDPIYNPETVKQGYGSVQDGFGSDPHWGFAGYMDVDKARWSRECSVCGKIEYTYNQEPVIINKGLKPKFNDN